MGTQIKIEDNPVLVFEGAARGSLSASMIVPGVGGPASELVEIRTGDHAGASSTVQLSKMEAEVFALVLSKLVDDLNGSQRKGVAEWNGDAITRDELIKQLLSLPREAHIGVRLFHETVGLFGLVEARDQDGGLHPIEAAAGDLSCALSAWGMTAEQLHRVVNGAVGAENS